MYALKIDADTASAIAFSGNRYQWSDTLESLGYASEGTFPLLCHYSQGFEALARFWQSIV